MLKLENKFEYVTNIEIFKYFKRSFLNTKLDVTTLKNSEQIK